MPTFSLRSVLFCYVFLLGGGGGYFLLTMTDLPMVPLICKNEILCIRTVGFLSQHHLAIVGTTFMSNTIIRFTCLCPYANFDDLSRNELTSQHSVFLRKGHGKQSDVDFVLKPFAEYNVVNALIFLFCRDHRTPASNLDFKLVQPESNQCQQSSTLGSCNAF